MGSSQSRAGYRIVEVLKGSPGETSGFQPYLDFIISINGTDLIESQILFQDLIKSNENCPITLGVISLETMELREVQVTPAAWEGKGLLGMNLRFEDITQAMENILHITKVFPNTPAANAGLQENEYILGSQDSKIHDSSDIQAILERNGEIKLAIYNKSHKSVRIAILESVDGSVGVEIASGVLHRLNHS